jgi:hypothetical protein
LAKSTGGKAKARENSGDPPGQTGPSYPCPSPTKYVVHDPNSPIQAIAWLTDISNLGRALRKHEAGSGNYSILGYGIFIFHIGLNPGKFVEIKI